VSEAIDPNGHCSPFVPANVEPLGAQFVDPRRRKSDPWSQNLAAFLFSLGGPEGPEPALGERKPGLSHFGRDPRPCLVVDKGAGLLGSQES
jgi:hypothetical protein